MSDGNFNRALLPHTPYASGLKAGKAMARMKAQEAFAAWLQADSPSLSPDQLRAKQADFAAHLSALL